MNQNGERRSSFGRAALSAFLIAGMSLLSAANARAAAGIHEEAAVPDAPSSAASCQSAARSAQPAPPQTKAPAAAPKKEEPPVKVIKADNWEKVENVITAVGNVEIRYGDLVLYADHAVYDETTKDVTADGHVSVIRGGDSFTADHLEFNLESGLGTARPVMGLVQPMYRYESSTFERKTPDLFDLGKCKITGCTQPVPRWEFSATQASFVRDEYVEMWNPVLRIKNVPVMYLPFMRYPLTQERATGFLMPGIGYSPRKGFTLTQQFYLTMGRSMDATFSFDYYGAKGAGGGVEYRYLFAGGTGGRLNAYYFIYSPPETGVKPDNALILRWQHNQMLPLGFRFVAAVDYQNSFAFSREFDNDYARALVYNRSSQIYLTRSWTWANFSARVGRFETVYTAADMTTVRESMPEIRFNTFRRKLLGPVYFALSSTLNTWGYGTAAQFEKGTERRSSELNLAPTLSLPLNTIPWFTLNLTAAGHISYYDNSLDPATKKIVDKNLFSGNYTLSAAFTGPVFYRIYTSKKSGTRIKHMIEPDITYKYDSPAVDADLIVTMAGRYYRYHYVSYGLTNRVLMKRNDPKARAKEVLTWGITQTYYLDPDDSPLSRYRLPDGTIPRYTDLSNYVRFFPVGDINLDFRVGYNTYIKTLSSVRASAGLGSPADDLHFSLSWYKSTNPYYESAFYNREQIGASAGLKIKGLDLALYGDIQYNIRDRKMLYTNATLAWNWQCLDFRVDAQAFYFRDKPEVQIRFSIGLGNITPSSDSLGPRSSADNAYLSATGTRRAGN